VSVSPLLDDYAEQDNGPWRVTVAVRAVRHAFCPGEGRDALVVLDEFVTRSLAELPTPDAHVARVEVERRVEWMGEHTGDGGVLSCHLVVEQLAHEVVRDFSMNKASLLAVATATDHLPPTAGDDHWTGWRLARVSVARAGEVGPL
jgi:hypothetical protein